MTNLNKKQAEEMLRTSFQAYLEHKEFNIDLSLIVYNLFCFGKAIGAIREASDDYGLNETFDNFLKEIHLSDEDFIKHWPMHRKVRPHTEAA